MDFNATHLFLRLGAGHVQTRKSKIVHFCVLGFLQNLDFSYHKNIIKYFFQSKINDYMELNYKYELFETFIHEIIKKGGFYCI